MFRVSVLATATATASLDLGQCAMSISASPDRMRVVAGGRDVLKLLTFNADSQTLEEERNLRVGRQNMSLSCVDVMWHPLEGCANELATAATNGHVVLWDLTTPGENKIKHIIKAHQRTATCVAYHPGEAAALFSGSQDETVRRWDTRALAAAATEFPIKECVRSLRCNPHNPHQFAVALEGGTVQVWDARQPLACELKIQAHQGPVYTVAWHPTRRNCLASGGRDKIIRVWDTGVKESPVKEPLLAKDTPQARESLRASIPTIASVARVLWRPGHADQLTSCSLVHDRQIHVWDLRREHLPILSFEEHTNVTTDMLWDADGVNVLVSVGKDNCIIRHAVCDARRTALDAELQSFGVGWGIRDEIVNFCKPRGSALAQSPDKQQAAPGVRQFFSSRAPRPQLGPAFESVLRVQTLNPGLAPTSEVFEHLATTYKLAATDIGETPSVLALHNANAAAQVNAMEHAQTWRVLAELWQSVQAAPAAPVAPATTDSRGYKYSLFDAPVDILEASQVDGAPTLAGGVPASKGVAGAAGVAGVAPEASALRREVVAHRDAVGSDNDTDTESMGDSQDDSDGPLDHLERPDASRSFASSAAAAARDPVTSVAASVVRPPPFSFSGVVDCLLQSYGSNGDPQMCVALLLVFGERFFPGVGIALQLPWFHAYCGLLERHQLWNQRTAVIRQATLAEINELNTDSTSVYTGCGGCGKPLLGKSGWRCAEKCKDIAGMCFFCRQPVRGLHVWCQGCGHGGHPHHLKEWFSMTRECPAGCGHQCEFS